MSFKRIVLLLSAAWFSATLAGAVHAEADVLVHESLALVEQGKAQQAFDQLAAVEEKRAGDPDFDTVLGIAANETGQFTRAVFALERVLSVQPGNSRARAELGRALFALGDNQAARQVLQETKRDAIPAEVAHKIDEFLQGKFLFRIFGKTNRLFEPEEHFADSSRIYRVASLSGPGNRKMNFTETIGSTSPNGRYYAIRPEAVRFSVANGVLSRSTATVTATNTLGGFGPPQTLAKNIGQDGTLPYFTYTPGTSARNSMVSIHFAISRNDETVNFHKEVAIRNVP